LKLHHFLKTFVEEFLKRNPAFKIFKNMRLNPKRVLVGMSGGVDSSVTAALLVEQGYEVIGITIKTYKYEDVGGNVANDSSCCSLDGINDARRISQILGIPHYIVDFTESFKKNVIDYFVEDYLAGNTPNPCTRCNRTIKWGEMLKKADALGAQYIAMGHYAQVFKNEETGRYNLKRGKDQRKDQSYMLWGLTQEQLSRTLFPLADMTKEEARAIAERFKLPIAGKQESYEICFIADNDYNRFLKARLPELEEKVAGGDIVLKGKKIGEHTGYPFYTIGQRKGLGISHPEPLYVLNVLPETNTVEVGLENELYHSGLLAHSVNFIQYETLTEPKLLTAKIRYKDKGAEAWCSMTDDGLLKLEFLEPRSAITPGQSLVLYDGDDVVGGAVIKEWF
jgi:tRNA-specific 2-thiouridylase